MQMLALRKHRKSFSRCHIIETQLNGLSYNPAEHRNSNKDWTDNSPVCKAPMCG